MINRKGAELLCLEEETLIGMNWIDNFIPAAQRDEVRRVFDRLISGEKVQVEHYENSIVNSQGEQLQMSWHNTLVRDANGNITGTLSSAEDITELRRSEKALRRSQKMDAIGQLTGGIAHDFNNILGIILGNADLIKQKAREQPAIESRITIIESAAQRAANLTRQLLDFSRDESDENAVVSPNTIISGMDDLIRRTVTPQITVKSLLAENAWYVRINPGDFQDSLLNLTLNARDAMPAGGTLIFRTRVCELRDHERRRHGGIIPGEYVKVEVEDSGTGIPPEAQERIFEPFYTTKGVGKGTGLGLSMVYGFVKRSNGFIDVHSDPGCGTRFCIYLPRASAAE
jgi:PAS domain S-box-containing protein